MVKIRLKRFGRRNRPFYRICAMDSRTQRDGRPIEELGFYDPIEQDDEKALTVKTDRAAYWISVGAQPSDTVRSLFVKAGVEGVTPAEPVKPAAPSA